MRYIWNFKRRGVAYNDMQHACEDIATGVVKYSMNKNSSDNISTILIGFKNFENAMRDPNFVGIVGNRCEMIRESYDFSEMQWI